jgi:phage-related protein
MSNKPTVTLTFAGDSEKLSKAFKDVGASADQMGKKVSDTSDSFTKVGRSTDDFVDKADKSEQRAMGFRDTITGLQDSFKGLTDSSLSMSDRLLTLGMGVGDLASGFANLLIPAMSKFGGWLASTTVGTYAISAAQTVWAAVTKGVSTAMTFLNTVMKANPILFIVGLIATLVGAFILLWNKSAGFRNFWIGVWKAIQNIVGAVVKWIGGVWNGLVGFFRNSPLGAIVKGIFNGIKAAVQAVGRVIGWLVDVIRGAIGWFNELIGKANNPALRGGGGFTPIKRHHTGGVVPGMLGTEQLRVLQAGERVVPRGQDGNGGGGGTVTFEGDTDSAFAQAFQKLVRTGKIRIA